MRLRIYVVDKFERVSRRSFGDTFFVILIEVKDIGKILKIRMITGGIKLTKCGRVLRCLGG
jgi:hypothetical protein